MSKPSMSKPFVILHLGLGSFHRAHQAVYLHRLIEQEIAEGKSPSWVLAGGNLRPDMADTIEALQRQGGAYTLETVSPAGERHYERITSIRHIIPYEASLAGLIDVGADSNTRIISFTVTEAGYYLDSENRLETTYTELASDLAGTTRSTIYGALAAILNERKKRGSGPVTLLNCDNLRSNGERFQKGFADFLSRRSDQDLLKWVESSTSAPNDMVDRITPRPLPEVAQRVKDVTGWDDGAPVMGEKFIQWVIEDHFINGRPEWEKAGAQLVGSVLPYEEAKIRILNSTHSCFAWAGTLIGLNYIHEGVENPAIRKMAFDYVTDDVIPSLHASMSPYPVDLAAYRDVVIDRFSNPHLRDTNQRVAADGFAKIPGFLWPTIRECLARGASIAATAKLPALFFEFLGRWHRGELPFEYQDQGMDAKSAHAIFESADPLAAFSRDPILWGPLAGDQRLVDALAAAHREVLAFVKDNSHG
jgi:D-arabinitol 4-dehydrogenase